MKYLLYGMGISNQAVLKFFRLHHMNYVVVIDDKNGTLDEKTILFLLRDINIIVKSPGIVFHAKIITIAQRLHIEVISDLELYYRLYPEIASVIVTGSVGKTSTVNLISQMLSKQTKEIPPIGNVGLPIFEHLCNKDEDSTILIEASSFMLHHTYSVVPQVYVVTNIFAHHLDYHQTIENYIFDKTKLVANMKEDGLLVYNLDCNILKEQFEKLNNVHQKTFSLTNKKANCYIEDGSIVLDDEPIIKVADILKHETHQLYNAMASCLVADYYHIDKSKLRNVLKHFKGIKYRFETIYHQNHLVIINDAKSTTPIATLAAIEAVEKQYGSFAKILILGGISKNESYDILNKKLSQYKCVYCFGHSKFDIAQKMNVPLVKIMDNMDDVINDISFFEPLVVLFSPGCVSFDQFRSFEERGMHFNLLIKNKIKSIKAL